MSLDQDAILRRRKYRELFFWFFLSVILAGLAGWLIGRLTGEDKSGRGESEEMNADDRKRVAYGVVFEELVFKAHDGGDSRIKLDVDVAYSVANEVATLRGEKERRLYYQNIVYTVAALLDACADVGGTLRSEGERESRITCGTLENPSTCVQDAVRELIGRRHPSGESRQDVVWLAMQQAVEAFGGGGANDGVFNAAGFSAALMRIAGLNGVIDGLLVRAILSGRSDVEVLAGGSHYRLVGHGVSDDRD